MVAIVVIISSCNNRTDISTISDDIHVQELDAKIIGTICDDDSANIFLSGFNLDIDVTESGILCVLDGGNCELLVFSNTGTLINRFGGKGEGPGELMAPITITTINEIIAVWDMGTNRMNYWSPKYGYQESTRFNLRGVYPNSVIDKQGILWALKIVGPENSNSLNVDVIAYKNNSENIIYSFLVDVAMSKDRQAIAFSYTPIISAAFNSGIAISTSIDYRIIRIDKAGNEWTRPNISVPLSDDEKERLSRPAAVSGGEYVYPPMTEHAPNINHIYRVSNEELWIATPVEKDSLTVRADRFTNHGEYIGSAWINKYSTEIIINNGIMYVLHEPQYAAPSILLYEIVNREH